MRMNNTNGSQGPNESHSSNFDNELEELSNDGRPISRLLYIGETTKDQKLKERIANLGLEIFTWYGDTHPADMFCGGVYALCWAAQELYPDHQVDMEDLIGFVKCVTQWYRPEWNNPTDGMKNVRFVLRVLHLTSMIKEIDMETGVLKMSPPTADVAYLVERFKLTPNFADFVKKVIEAPKKFSGEQLRELRKKHLEFTFAGF